MNVGWLDSSLSIMEQGIQVNIELEQHTAGATYPVMWSLWARLYLITLTNVTKNRIKLTIDSYMGLGKHGLDNINRDDTKGASTLSRFLLTCLLFTLQKL